MHGVPRQQQGRTPDGEEAGRSFINVHAQLLDEEVNHINKNDLVTEVAGKIQLSRRSVRSVVDATMETIAASLEKRRKLMLIGFGTFRVAKRGARQVNHPQTGDTIRIDATHVAVFRPGTALKKRVAAKRPRGRPKKKLT